MDVVAYHKAVEISMMRELMRYGQEQFEEDWNLMLALSFFIAVQGKTHFQPMFESCVQRVLAYHANEPEAVSNYFIQERMRGELFDGLSEGL